MKYNFFSSSSILSKFLVFNLVAFLILGIFTFLYLNAIKPNLVKNRSNQHARIIDNTSDHIKRLNIEFTKESTTEFLLDARFLFQNLDRVQLSPIFIFSSDLPIDVSWTFCLITKTS